MIFSSLLSLLAGSLTVLQNTVNKDVASRISLQLSLVINNALVLILSFAVYFLLDLFPPDSLPSIFRAKGGLGEFNWRFLVPGLCGFLFITVTPWAVERAGAVRVFVGVILAQIVVSLLWDYFAESLPLSFTRLLGAGLALAGALIASR